MTPQPKKLKCAAPDCEAKFVPEKPWQKFHSTKCANRELQRRRRARLAADEVGKILSSTA